MFDQITALSPTPPTDAAPVPITGYRASQYLVNEWDIPRVEQTLQLLDAGQFRWASDLRTSMRRDSRMRGAESQLADTFVGFDIELEEGPSAHGNSPMESMRREGEGLFGKGGVTANPALLREVIEDLAGFALAFCWLRFEASEDGARWTPHLTPWPIGSVEQDLRAAGQYVALTADGQRIPIQGEHWIEFRQTPTLPHRRGAVRSIARDYISRGFALGDWGIASAGNSPKRIGELPPDIAVNSPEGRQFARDLARLDQPYSGMIHMSGGKVTALKPGDLSHKIHMDYAATAEESYAIAYLGQSGTVKKGDTGTYGAVKELNGVRYDVIRGLATGVTGGLNEVLRRWAVYNFARAVYPRVCIEVPDLEAEQTRTEELKRRTPMLDELEQLRAIDTLTPDLVTTIARRYGQPMSEHEIAIWTKPKAAPPPQIAPPPTFP